MRAENAAASPSGGHEHTGLDVRCPDDCVETELLSRLIAAASDLGLLVDAQGVVQDISVGDALAATGPWRSLVGQRWRDTVLADSQPKIDEMLRDARSTGSSRARELNQRLGGSADVPFRFTAVLFDRKDQRVLVLGRDQRGISAVQQRMVAAQQAMDREYERLRQSETRYRLLFHVTGECVIVADAASLKIVEANPATATLLGTSVQALHSTSVEQCFDAAAWPRAHALLDQVNAGARPTDVRVRLRGGEGREVTLAASLFRQSGTPLLLLRLRPAGIVEELAGAATSRTTRMLTALDALPDGFVVISEDERIVCANPAFCEMVQQPHENQVVGQPLSRWLGRPGVDLDILLANLREHGSVRNFSTIVRGEYGAQQEAVVSAVSALDGNYPCFGFAVRTVSARLTLVRQSVVPAARSVDQLRELVGRLTLKEIIRESTDLIERLCIEAALKVSGDNRASAAQLLGLSRQGLYSKLRRYGIGELGPLD